MNLNYLNQIKKKGYVVIKNGFEKKLINKLLIEAKNFSQKKDNLVKARLAVDSKLIISPHSHSLNFLKIINHKMVEYFCMRLLNDPFYNSLKKLPNYCLNHSIIRSSGKKVLKFHRDDRNPPSTNNEVCYLQFILALEESNKKNGCTIVVPGSHRKNTYVQNINKHKKKYIELKSGDILIYDGRLWHSAGSNKTDGTRWMFIFGFARWHLRQTYDFTRNISKKLLKTLKKKEILKLGFHAITKFDEKSSDTTGQRCNLNYAMANFKKVLKNSKR